MLAQALLGAGLAGTYMPGLKELSDRTAGEARQRRAIAFYTSFGIGSSLSLWMAGALQSHFGWRAAFLVSGARPIAAAALILVALPARPFTASAVSRRGLFGIVLRDRRITRYVIGYAAHCWELFAFRSWIVAFLSFAAGGAHLSPPTIAAASICSDRRPVSRATRSRPAAGSPARSDGWWRSARCWRL